MMLLRNVQMGLKSLWAAKQRSVLALLGIVIGIGSVIAMVSIGIIVKEHSLKQFLEMGTDYIVVSKGWGGSDGPKITYDQAIELSKRLRSIKDSSPAGISSSQFTYQGNSYNPQLIGAISNFLSINRLKLKEGRFITDFDKNMPYCVIGDELVKQLNENGVTKILGSQIKMQERLFTVIGILEREGSSGLKPFNANRSLIIPFSTYDRVFPDSDITDVLARMRDGLDPVVVTKDITNYFRVRDPELQIEVRNAEEMIRQAEKQMQMFTLLLGAIGSISLIVGGVGVMNVMLVSVTERKKEIGIRRALGALRRDIQVQFLIESLVLCFLGGLIGLLIGVGASYLIAQQNGWEFILSNVAVALGIGVSTLVGIFFGYYPARSASMLDPIVALRS